MGVGWEIPKTASGRTTFVDSPNAENGLLFEIDVSGRFLSSGLEDSAKIASDYRPVVQAAKGKPVYRSRVTQCQAGPLIQARIDQTLTDLQYAAGSFAGIGFHFHGLAQCIVATVDVVEKLNVAFVVRPSGEVSHIDRNLAFQLLFVV